ncbi:MAG: hypothetical protein AABW79_02310 [Nanoarchaeota archaeon]
MGKRCGFCKADTGDERAFEVCDKCGFGIWGPKMFKAIRENMEGAKEKGDLFQGSVSG